MRQITKQDLLDLFRTGANKAQIASILAISQSELEELTAHYEADSPGFLNSLETAKHFRQALAKKNTLASLVEGDVDMSKWELERTDPIYNPKTVSISVPIEALMLPEEKERLLSKFPSIHGNLALQEGTE